MAGAGDHRLGYIDGDVAHDDSLGCSERFLAADRKYGHGQLGSLKDFIILHVLRESGELRKARPHGARLGILRGIIRTRSLVRLGGIAGEIVPDAIEIDALASLYQPLGIRSVEGEVP